MNNFNLIGNWILSWFKSPSPSPSRATQTDNPDTAVPTSAHRDETTVPARIEVDEKPNAWVRSDDQEGMTCVICYQPFTNSGEHRLCCLKCGHTFGKSCIERCLKNQPRCPQCNSRASEKDVRIIYAQNLKALDTAKKNQAISAIDRFITERNKAIAEKNNAISSMDRFITERNKATVEKNNAISAIDRFITERNKAIAEKNNAISSMDRFITERNKAIAEKNHAITEMTNAITARDIVLAELSKEKELNKNFESECAQFRQMNQQIDADAEDRVAHDEVGHLKGKSRYRYRDTTVCSAWQPSTSKVPYAAVPSSTGSGNLQFSRVKTFFLPGEAEAHIGAYSERLKKLVVSQSYKSKSLFYPDGMFGIKQFNLHDKKVSLQTPIHEKEIRDLQFCPSQSEILLSVGMDQRGILTDINTNMNVQTFNSESPLWSCAWSTMSQHIFYAGASNGKVLVYDLRNPQNLLNSFNIPSTDRTPVAGIRFVPRFYKLNNSFTSNGLLLQQKYSAWFCELTDEEPKFHQLPIYSTFQSIDFEPKSRHVLFSARDSTNITRHMVGELTQYYSKINGANVCSCNIVQTFTVENGVKIDKEAMSSRRSSIFSPDEGRVLVAGNGLPGSANIWDVSDPTWKLSLPMPQASLCLDFVPSCVDKNFYLNVITSQGVSVYGHN